MRAIYKCGEDEVVIWMIAYCIYVYSRQFEICIEEKRGSYMLYRKLNGGIEVILPEARVYVTPYRHVTIALLYTIKRESLHILHQH